MWLKSAARSSLSAPPAPSGLTALWLHHSLLPVSRVGPRPAFTFCTKKVPLKNKSSLNEELD